jgi:hypothetical protein
LQILLTALVFALRRVGMISYSQPKVYLALFGLEAMCGMLLAIAVQRAVSVGDGGSHNGSDYFRKETQ